jgi:DNA-binding response OmpR family regulator
MRHVSQPSSSQLPPIVLLVEDDPDTRDLYETAFGLSGLWVAKASEPADALEYAADLRPDSVVMDVGLPDPSDGFALAKALREDTRLRDTPILAVTGLDREKVEPGADLFSGVFYKPVSLQQLVRRIKWLSAKSTVLRARADEVRARVPHLLAKSTTLLEKSHRLTDQLGAVTATPSDVETVRYCPKCRKPLRFSESRTLGGTTFDYYLACQSGCGLYCYDQSLQQIITLVG